jgi:hypothetical protein
MIDRPDIEALLAACKVVLDAPDDRSITGSDWITAFTSGEILRTEEAAMVGDVSPDTVLRRITESLQTDRPLGVRIVKSVCLISRCQWLDWIKRNEGLPAYLAAKTRADSLKSRSPPQQSAPLAAMPARRA